MKPIFQLFALHYEACKERANFLNYLGYECLTLVTYILTLPLSSLDAIPEYTEK